MIRQVVSPVLRSVIAASLVNDTTSTKSVTSWGIADSSVTSALASMATGTVDVLGVHDSNGNIDAYGWISGIPYALAQRGVQFAAQLCGYVGNNGRGWNSNGSSHPGGGALDGNWTVGLHDNISEFDFSSWGMHQAARLDTGTNNTSGELTCGLNDVSLANAVRPQHDLYADLWYGRFASGGVVAAHKHHTRRNTSNGVGGASATLDSTDGGNGNEIVRSRRSIVADPLNTSLTQDPFWIDWSTNADAKTYIAAMRWSHQSRSVGFSDHCVYQGGGQSADDAANSLTGSTKRISAGWYLSTLRTEQIARSGSAKIIMFLTMGVNDAGDGGTSLDGVNANNTYEGFYSNTSALIDWVRSVYSTEAGGNLSELHFVIVPGFTMDSAGVGKDIAHAAEIIPAAKQLAMDYPNTACYNFRDVFDAADMAANGYWRSGGTDKNHLNGSTAYNALATTMVDHLGGWVS